MSRKTGKQRDISSSQLHPVRQLAFVFVIGFTIVMVIAGLSKLIAAQAYFSLEPSSQVAEVGQNKTVDVNLDTGSSGARYGVVQVNFDPSHLSFVKFTAGSSPYDIVQQQSGDNYYRFTFYHNTSDLKGNFELGSLTFKAKSVSQTINTPISFDPYSTAAINSATGNLSASYANAIIKINFQTPQPPPPPPTPPPSPQPSPPPRTPQPSLPPPTSPSPPTPPSPPPAQNPDPATPEPYPLPFDELGGAGDGVFFDTPEREPKTTSLQRIIILALVGAVLASIIYTLYVSKDRIRNFFESLDLTKIKSEKNKIKKAGSKLIAKYTGSIATRAHTSSTNGHSTQETKPTTKSDNKTINPIKKTIQVHHVDQKRDEPASHQPDEPQVIRPQTVIKTHSDEPKKPLDSYVQAAITPEVLQEDTSTHDIPQSAWDGIREQQEERAKARKNKSIVDEDVPDMYEIAKEHPESYGNPNFGDEDTPLSKKNDDS